MELRQVYKIHIFCFSRTQSVSENTNPTSTMNSSAHQTNIPPRPPTQLRQCLTVPPRATTTTRDPSRVATATRDQPGVATATRDQPGVAVTTRDQPRSNSTARDVKREKLNAHDAAVASDHALSLAKSGSKLSMGTASSGYGSYVSAGSLSSGKI